MNFKLKSLKEIKKMVHMFDLAKILDQMSILI